MYPRTIMMVAAAYTSMIQSYLGQDQDQDQDHDLDLNQLDKDQIRSDQSDLSSEERFIRIASSEGVDLSVFDLSGIERNIYWFLNNREKVRSPRAYIIKMVKDCPPKRPKAEVGFKPPVQKKDPDNAETTEVYGYSVEILDEWSEKLDNEAFRAILSALPQHSRVLFPTLSNVRESRAKSRVFIAEGLKRGVL